MPVYVETAEGLVKPLSQTQDIVTKINILLQDIHDIKLQNKRNNILNAHRNHPKDTSEENALDDTCLIYNNTSFYLPPDILNNPGHHAPSPNHVPSIDGNASTPQKQAPFLNCFHPHHPMRIRQTTTLIAPGMT